MYRFVRWLCLHRLPTFQPLCRLAPLAAMFAVLGVFDVRFVRCSLLVLRGEDAVFPYKFPQFLYMVLYFHLTRDGAIPSTNPTYPDFPQPARAAAAAISMFHVPPRVLDVQVQRLEQLRLGRLVGRGEGGAELASRILRTVEPQRPLLR